MPADAAGGLEARRGRMVARRLPRQAAGLLRSQDRARASASRSATRSPSTCSAATSPPPSPTCARSSGARIGINFVMVFSPNTFAGAPHTHLATVTFPNGSRRGARCRGSCASSAQAYPMVTSVRVKDALEAVNDVVVAARHGDPRRELHRPDREPPGARRRACGRPPGAALRCGGAEDARRHPGAAARRPMRSNTGCSGSPPPCSACSPARSPPISSSRGS